MPEGTTSLSPYASVPTPDDERICAPINEGVPEYIHGLSWSKPDFSRLEHKIIRTFAIDRKKRPDRTCIPCAICSGQKPKYLDGAVLWSSDGTLRIIGHRCAKRSEHFGAAEYNSMLRKARQTQLDSIAWDWLYANISALQPLATDLTLLSKVAIFIDAQSREFSRRLPHIWKALKNFADRTDGVITVEQELSVSRLAASEMARSSTRSSASRYETVYVGTMQGTSLFKQPKRDWAKQVEDCLKALAEVPEGEGDVPMEELISRGDDVPTVTAGKTLRNLEIALKVTDELSNACRFFEPSNIKTLEEWGIDRRNPHPYKTVRFGQQVQIIAEDLSRARLTAHCPKFPDMSLLKQVVEAGSNLAGLLR